MWRTARGVELVSLRLGIDLHSPVGRALLSMLGIVAELERWWTHERAASGRDAARRRDVTFGRKPRLDHAQRARLERLLAIGTPSRRIAELLGVSKGTVSREAARLRAFDAGRVA